LIFSHLLSYGCKGTLVLGVGYSPGAIQHAAQAPALRVANPLFAERLSAIANVKKR
jgi:hypothetical protein